MAVESTTTPLGTPLPVATLRDVDGSRHAVPDIAGGRPLLVAFVCNHCPYVRHIEDAFGRVTGELIDRGLAVVAVCSNDAGSHSDDSPEHLAAQRDRADWRFPYLVDEDQSFARLVGAVCTPDLFLFDATGHLAYRGAFDGSTPKNGVEVTGEDLRNAAEALLEGRAVPAEQRPAMGCGIKWLPGSEPGS